MEIMSAPAPAGIACFVLLSVGGVNKGAGDHGGLASARHDGAKGMLGIEGAWLLACALAVTRLHEGGTDEGGVVLRGLGVHQLVQRLGLAAVDGAACADEDAGGETELLRAGDGGDGRLGINGPAGGVVVFAVGGVHHRAGDDGEVATFDLGAGGAGGFIGGHVALIGGVGVLGDERSK